MDSTYSDFSGTDLDPDADMDFDDFDDEGNDLLPIIGLSAAVAAVVGAILVLAGRRRKPTPKERIADMFEDLGKEGGKRAKTVARAVSKSDLGGLLGDALDKAKSAADDFDLGDTVSDVRKRARKMSKDVDLSSLLEDAMDRAGDAAKFARHRVDEASTFARHRADDARKGASNLSMPDIDGKDVGNFLESLRDKVADIVEAVRSEAVPKAAEAMKDGVIPAAGSVAGTVAGTVARTVREDVMPAAQDAFERVRDDVLPEAQKRAGKFLDDAEVGKRARTIGRTAGEGAGSLAEMARTLALGVAGRVIQDYIPGAQKVGGKAVNTMLEDFLPAAGRRAGRAAGVVGDLAQQTPGALSDLLGSARDKAQDAMDKAGPLAADAATFAGHRAAEAATFTGHRAAEAATFAGHRAGEAFTFGKHRLSDAASAVGDHRNGVGKGIGKAASSAGQGVKGVVGSAFGGASYLTRETTRILFWLSLLGGIILMAFVPDKERQKEIVGNVFQFFGEVREMWKDLQGPDGDDA